MGKIIVVGNKKVGKTSIINKIIFGVFSERYSPTEDCKIYKYGNDDIWECSGNNSLYYINADKAIIIADQDNLYNIEEYYNSILEIAGKIEIIVIINKIDLIRTKYIKNKKYKYISCKKDNLENFFSYK